MAASTPVLGSSLHYRIVFVEKGKGVWAIDLSRMIYSHHQRTLSASSR